MLFFSSVFNLFLLILLVLRGGTFCDLASFFFRKVFGWFSRNYYKLFICYLIAHGVNVTWLIPEFPYFWTLHLFPFLAIINNAWRSNFCVNFLFWDYFLRLNFQIHNYLTKEISWFLSSLKHLCLILSPKGCSNLHLNQQGLTVPLWLNFCSYLNKTNE